MINETINATLNASMNASMNESLAPGFFVRGGWMDLAPLFAMCCALFIVFVVPRIVEKISKLTESLPDSLSIEKDITYLIEYKLQKGRPASFKKPKTKSTKRLVKFISNDTDFWKKLRKLTFEDINTDETLELLQDEIKSYQKINAFNELGKEDYDYERSDWFY